MKPFIVLWFSSIFLLNIGLEHLKSQEIALSDLQAGWEAYEKIANEYIYEIAEYREGTIARTKKMSRKRDLYLVTMLVAGAKTTTIFGKNDIYVFSISERNNSGDLILESVVPTGEYYDNNLKNQAGRDSTLTPCELEVIFGLKINHIFSDGWARIDKIELSTDSSKVIVAFELENNEQPQNINQAKLKNGRAIFRNDRFFLPERLEFIPSTGTDPGFSETVILTNEFDESGQIPRLSRQKLEYSGGYSIEYRVNYFDETLSTHDFKVSAFGFPEPNFVRTSLFRWAILLVFGGIIVGIILWGYFSKKINV